MNKLIAVLSITFLILLGLAVRVTAANLHSIQNSKTLQGEKFVKGEVLVRFKNTGNLASEQAAMARTHGVQRFNRVDDKGLQKVKLRPGHSVEQAVLDFRADPAVEHVQPNYIYKMDAVPNDPQYGQQWGLKNTGQTITSPDFGTNNPGTSGADMGMETAWTTATDCRSAIVAVIDTGVNYNHTDLAANMWSDNASFPNHGFDFVDDDNDPLDNSTNGGGHGTHVAGIIGSVGNNGIGNAGVCWTAKIMALRALNQEGLGNSAAIASAVNFAVANGAKVINMSLGAQVATEDTVEAAAITAAVTAGLVVLASAGNTGGDNDATPRFPCNHSGVYCIGAVDQSHARVTGTNRGATTVDIGAPGANVLSEINGTHATGSNDTFLTGWTLGTGWARQAAVGAHGTVISVPATWNDAAGPNYTASLATIAFKSFNTSGLSNATFKFSAIFDTESGQDGIIFFQNTGSAADPSNAGTNLGGLSGALAEDTYTISLRNCISTLCTIGMMFVSDSDATVGKGAAIFNLHIDTLVLTTSDFIVYSGTSMAVPHVAGLAALLFTRNPNYTRADVEAAITGGGTTVAGLAGVYRTGKVANGAGAMAFINDPVNLRASVR